MRLFVCIEMPDEVINEIVRIQKLLQKEELFVGSYPQREQMHLTLQFIGDIPDELVPKVHMVLQQVIAFPFQVRLGNLDIFYSGSHIKVIFAHLIAKELQSLAAQINAVLHDIVIPEKRLFVPHLTVARVKEVENIRMLVTTINQTKVKPIIFMIDSFVLKQSLLDEQGATHTTLYMYELH